MVRGRSGYIEVYFQKTGLFFTTVEMREKGNVYDELEKLYEKIQGEVATEVISITATYFPILEKMNQVIAHLDVLLR